MPPEEDPHEKRLHEITEWLRYFQVAYLEQFEEELVFVENAAQSLNGCYWEVIEEYIRPYLKRTSSEDKIDHHKIISVMEVCVMHLLPINHPDEQSKEDLNSQLAIFIGKTILLSWNDEIKDIVDLPTFEREHLTWLKCVSIEGYPYFSNAATWCLFEQLCIEKNRNKLDHD